MMKHEFEKLIGMTIDPDCYEKIEFVYMNSEGFSNSNGKQEIAAYYKLHDMNGIERLYDDIIHKKFRTADFRKFTTDLAFFAYQYTDEVRKDLAGSAFKIFQDKTLVVLLSEYRIRRMKEWDELARTMQSYIEYDNLKKFDLSSGCLTNATHYNTILYDLLIRYRKDAKNE